MTEKQFVFERCLLEGFLRMKKAEENVSTIYRLTPCRKNKFASLYFLNSVVVTERAVVLPTQDLTDQLNFLWSISSVLWIELEDLNAPLLFGDSFVTEAKGGKSKGTKNRATVTRGPMPMSEDIAFVSVKGNASKMQEKKLQCDSKANLSAEDPSKWQKISIVISDRENTSSFRRAWKKLKTGILCYFVFEWFPCPPKNMHCLIQNLCHKTAHTATFKTLKSRLWLGIIALVRVTTSISHKSWVFCYYSAVFLVDAALTLCSLVSVLHRFFLDPFSVVTATARRAFTSLLRSTLFVAGVVLLKAIKSISTSSFLLCLGILIASRVLAWQLEGNLEFSS